MSDRFGAYGKMPSVGDFFRLNVPPGFVSVWDDWLQRVMLTNQEECGDAWDALYLTAPIWRFALPAGMAGDGAILGVLMPSVDRVGRRFPLTLVTTLDDRDVARSHFEQGTVYEQLEELALDALGDGMTREGLETGLKGLEPPAVSCLAKKMSGRSMMLIADEVGVSPFLAASYVSETFPDACLWTSIVDGKTHSMICGALPDGAQMQALFNLNSPIWNEVNCS